MRVHVQFGLIVFALAASAGCSRQPSTPTSSTPTDTTPAATAPASAETPAASATAPPAPSQPLPVAGAIPVTPDNFIRAESDTYMAGLAKDAGGIGKLQHRRVPASIDNQTVIRINRDTLYSSGVYDLEAGPVTVTLPDAGSRFQSVMFINQDHAAWTEYGAGPHTVTRDKAGTRYVVVGIRTLVDPADAKDVDEVHRLQDAISVSQKAPGTLSLPSWDPVSQKKVRDALIALNATMPDFRHAFGMRGQVDPVRHLIATAAAWGGNPDKDATYLNITPERNDGKVVYTLDVRDVPVDAFWSVSVYNADGYFQKNPYDAYSLNNLTAKKEADGTIRIRFGGCDGKIANCLPTSPGWNYTVRLYRPRQAILDGSWTFPAPQPVG